MPFKETDSDILKNQGCGSLKSVVNCSRHLPPLRFVSQQHYSVGKVAFQVGLYKMLGFDQNAGGPKSPLMNEGVGGVD